GLGDLARCTMAGDGPALPFLFRLALCDQWDSIRAIDDFGRAFSQRSPADTTGPALNRPVDPTAPPAALPEGRGGEALQRPAKAHLSCGSGPIVSADRSRRARHVSKARRGLPLAALALWRPPVGAHDSLCLRLLAPDLRRDSFGDGRSLRPLEQHP